MSGACEDHHDRSRHRQPAATSAASRWAACCRSRSAAWSGRSSSSITSARWISRPASRVRRRAAASAHRPVDGHLPVRRRDHASRQPRVRAADPPGRGQLDDRRPRHHALRALRARARAKAGGCTASRRGSRCRVEDEETDPAFAHYGARRICPTYEGGGCGRGWSPAKRSAPRPRSTPIRRCSTCIGDCDQGAKAQLPAEYRERAAYIVAGHGRGRRASATTRARCWCSRRASRCCSPRRAVRS